MTTQLKTLYSLRIPKTRNKHPDLESILKPVNNTKKYQDHIPAAILTIINGISLHRMVY